MKRRLIDLGRCCVDPLSPPRPEFMHRDGQDPRIYRIDGLGCLTRSLQGKGRYRCSADQVNRREAARLREVLRQATFGCGFAFWNVLLIGTPLGSPQNERGDVLARALAETISGPLARKLDRRARAASQCQEQ